MTNLSIEPNARIEFQIRHEDTEMLIVEKPARVPTQPGLGHEKDTLLNGLFATHGSVLQNVGASRDFGMLHRLDRDASGLIIVALKPRSFDILKQTFKDRAIKKFYYAIVKGAPNEQAGVIDRPLIEVSGKPKLARISSSGKQAVTAFRVIARSETASLLECRPATGRLHQIRVHLDLIGCPILGDAFYGPKKTRAAGTRLALHAHRLVLNHPTTSQRLNITTTFPRELRKLARDLSIDVPDNL